MRSVPGACRVMLKSGFARLASGRFTASSRALIYINTIMPLEKNLMMKFLSAITTILVVYLVVISYKLTYLLLYPPMNKSICVYVTFTLIFYCFISYWAYQKNKFASWLMIFSLLFSGMGGLILGVFMVPLSQIILKIVFTLLGIYFVFGSYKIYSYRPSSVNKVNRDQLKE